MRDSLAPEKIGSLFCSIKKKKKKRRHMKLPISGRDIFRYRIISLFQSRGSAVQWEQRKKRGLDKKKDERSGT